MYTKNHNILYVDDDTQNLFLFYSSLEQKYNIYTAESGAEALKILKEKPIQVIFADQRMPEMNGIQLLEKVAQEYPEIIRVLVTGYSDIDVVIDAINRGSVYRYISKPWDLDEIITTIKNALEIYELKHKNDVLTASLNTQNKLLGQKIEELNFLNTLNFELKSITDFRNAVLKILSRLQNELNATDGFYCVMEDNKLLARFPEIHIERAHDTVNFINNTNNINNKNMLDSARLFSSPDNKTIHLLPLGFQDHHLGYFLFIFDGLPDDSDFLFAQAAATVSASILYNVHVHKDELEKERYLMLGRMASMIVHDIKGPLTTIVGFVDLLQKELDFKKRTDYCAIIDEEISRLIEMIEELLSFSKGKTHLNLTNFSLRPFIQEILNLFDIAFQKDNILTEIEVDDSNTITGDKKKLRKVILNLLHNAREALNNKTGERRIWIKVENHNYNTRLIIANNGAPIPQKILSRLFTPFFSFQKDKGTGLGLAICKKIIEEHKGSIRVNSEFTETDFIIDFPQSSSTSTSF